MSKFFVICSRMFDYEFGDGGPTGFSNSDESLSDRSTNAPPGRRDDLAREVLKMVAAKLKNSDEGKYSSFGKHVSQELANLPNEMATYCRKVINEALFEAQMGTLNRTSRVTTDLPYPTEQGYSLLEPKSHTSNGHSTAAFFKKT